MIGRNRTNSILFLSKYTCNIVNTLATVGAIKMSIAGFVQEFKNFHLTADSIRVEAPSAIDFGTLSSHVYSRVKAPQDRLVLHSAEAVSTLYDGNSPLNCTLITTPLYYVSLMLALLCPNYYLFG